MQGYLRLDDIFEFGKHIGDEVEDVIEEDPQYMAWLDEEEVIEFDPEVIAVLEKKKII